MPNTINKVTYYGRDLIDLTADTVTPDKLFKGITAHAADGSSIIGTAEVTVVTSNNQTGLVIPSGLLIIAEGS